MNTAKSTAATQIDFVAVNDTAARPGLVTYWRMEGPTDLDALREAWADVGLPEDMLPNETSNGRALQLAMSEVAGRRKLSRPVRSGVRALVAESVNDAGELSHRTILQASVEDGTLQIEPTWLPAAAKLRSAYRQAKVEIDASAMSSWLSQQILPWLSGVILRPHGGIYFIPARYEASFDAVCEALDRVSKAQLFRIPVVESKSAVAAILDAVEREAEAMYAEMNEELARSGDDALGKRALKTRAEKCAELAAKLETYEDLLGVSLGGLREQCDSLTASVSAASLMLL